jgi:hypothetical protein
MDENTKKMIEQNIDEFNEKMTELIADRYNKAFSELAKGPEGFADNKEPERP